MQLSQRLTSASSTRGGVQVDPVALVDGEVGLHLLKLELVPVGV